MSSVEECACNKLNSFKSPWCNADCFVVITGASRGFGRAFAVELVKSMSSGKDHAASLNVLLMARDVNALRVTESEMYASLSTNSEMKLTILVSTSSLDMSNANKENLLNDLNPLFQLASSYPIKSNIQCQWNMLVHNAATLGNIHSKSYERFNIDALDTYYHTNLTIPILLTSLFVDYFTSYHQPITIVNISSLAADQPFPCMSDYCISKAARQMYFKCLPIDNPSLAVLNYSPGPLNTNMLKELIENHGNLQTRNEFSEMKMNGKIIEPNESARVCIGWLKRQIPIEPSIINSIPRLIHCSIHDKDYLNVWLGLRLDYYDAVGKV
ncbi:ankyrin repeat-containing, putative [Schistosoma mansoni]|uniref:Ankyrin repeat-containing, putative n=2 Tax=Schistosoma mansoni TaxID=6183 RepID=G4LZJ7_SCHMA|nr:ankyrin repeat-containing, putative [Schistosoma mansoni]|eukprot:XP_018646665.1 ankyrin repeat-containing, putative [Schistosoma mansoni]